MNTYDFSIITDPSFFLLFVGLSILLVSMVLIRLNQQNNIPKRRFIVVLILTLLISFSISLLSPFIKAIFKALAAGNQSEFSLAVFSIVTSLLVAYALYVIASFEQQRQEIRSQIENLKEISNKLLDKEAQQQEINRLSTLSGDYVQARVSAFFYIINIISSIDDENSEESHKRLTNLRLLQTLLGRNELEAIVSDLILIKTVLEDRRTTLSEDFKDPVQTYLKIMVNYYRGVTQASYDTNLVEQVEELAINILRLVKAS